MKDGEIVSNDFHLCLFHKKRVYTVCHPFPHIYTELAYAFAFDNKIYRAIYIRKRSYIYLGFGAEFHIVNLMQFKHTHRTHIKRKQ